MFYLQLAENEGESKQESFIKNREINAPKFNWNCTSRQELSSSEFMHRLHGRPMYYILSICSVTISALYFCPCYEFHIVTSIVHPYFFYLLPFASLHCTTPIEKLCADRSDGGTLSVPWFPLGSNILNAISVTLVPLPRPGEKPLPRCKPRSKLWPRPRPGVFQVSNAGGQQLAVQGKVGCPRSLAWF